MKKKHDDYLSLLRTLGWKLRGSSSSTPKRIYFNKIVPLSNLWSTQDLYFEGKPDRLNHVLPLNLQILRQEQPNPLRRHAINHLEKLQETHSQNAHDVKHATGGATRKMTAGTVVGYASKSTQLMQRVNALLSRPLMTTTMRKCTTTSMENVD